MKEYDKGQPTEEGLRVLIAIVAATLSRCFSR